MFVLLLTFLIVTTLSERAAATDISSHSSDDSNTIDFNSSVLETSVKKALSEGSTDKSVSFFIEALEEIPSIVSQLTLNIDSPPSSRHDASQHSLVDTVNHQLGLSVSSLNSALKAYSRLKMASDSSHKTIVQQSSQLKQVILKLDDEVYHQKKVVEKLSASKKNRLLEIESQASHTLSTLDSPEYAHIDSSLRLKLHSVVQAALSFSRESVELEANSLVDVAEELVSHNGKLAKEQLKYATEMSKALIGIQQASHEIGFFSESAIVNIGSLRSVLQNLVKESIESAIMKAEKNTDGFSSQLMRLQTLEKMLQTVINNKLRLISVDSD